MDRVFTYIDSQNKDTFHSIGQILIRPLAIACGRSFKLETETEEIKSTIQKVIAIGLSILLLPLALASFATGALLLHFSASHKKDFEQIQSFLNKKAPEKDKPKTNTYIDPKNPTKATDTVDNYQLDELKKISANLMEGSTGGLIDNSIYEIQYEDIDNGTHGEITPPVKYPTTEEEIKVYHAAIPKIVSSVREKVEASWVKLFLYQTYWM